MTGRLLNKAFGEEIYMNRALHLHPHRMLTENRISTDPGVFKLLLLDKDVNGSLWQALISESEWMLLGFWSKSLPASAHKSSLFDKNLLACYHGTRNWVLYDGTPSYPSWTGVIWPTESSNASLKGISRSQEEVAQLCMVSISVILPLSPSLHEWPHKVHPRITQWMKRRLGPNLLMIFTVWKYLQKVDSCSTIDISFLEYQWRIQVKGGLQ